MLTSKLHGFLAFSRLSLTSLLPRRRYAALDELMEAPDGHWIHQVRLITPKPSPNAR